MNSYVRKLEDKYIIYGYKHIITFYNKGNCGTYINILKKEIVDFVEENEMEGEKIEEKEGLFVCLDLFFRCNYVTYDFIEHIYVKYEKDKEYSEEYDDDIVLEILREEINFIKSN